MVPGRRGGTITECATPAHRGAEGGYWIGSPPPGHSLRKSLVRDRLRNLRRAPFSADPPELVYGRVEATRERDHIPGPIGAAYPHRIGSLRYDDDHPLWNDYERAVRAAADIANPTPAAVLERLSRHPQFAEWEAAEAAGVRAYRERERERKPKATLSTARAAALWRAEFIANKGDPTSAEYLDTLTPAGRANALRRAGRISEARAIERDMRHRRKHGPRLHRA